MSSKIRVAIIGGGICGCSLALGLLGHPNLEFYVFEKKSAFGERGAGVGLHTRSANALRAMNIDPIPIFEASGAVLSDNFRCFVATGEHRGKVLFELPGGGYNVSRNRWLDELLKLLPTERLLTDKTLIKVRDGVDSRYTLEFGDGSEYEADVLVGCDGIHSTIRKAILEDEFPELIEPVFGGYWDTRGTITPQRAAEKFGTKLFDPTKLSATALTGSGAFMLFKPRDDGNTYGVILSVLANSEYDSTAWKTKLSRELLEVAYKDWDAEFRDAVIDCLLTDDQGPGVIYSIYQSARTPIYHRSNICIIGDAAHAMLPWMGIGAEMAMEDAAVLASLLGKISSSSDVEAALAAFDRTRRETIQRLIDRSSDAGKLHTGQLGLDPADLSGHDPQEWWQEIDRFDLRTHIEGAQVLFAQLRDGPEIS